MEERQKQVQVGAGLQDSRLNQEFINWLQKWGNRILTVVLVVVAVYAGKKFWDKKQLDWVDSAFADWEATRNFEGGFVKGNPLALIDIADDHSGQASVPELARLDAASRYLRAAIMGIDAAADPANITPEDALTEARVNEYLANAEALYREVLEATSDKPRKLILAQAARRGIVAVLLSRGGDEDFSEAEALLNEVINAAESTGGLQDQAASARGLLEQLPELRRPPIVVATAELPKSALDLPPEPDPEPESEIGPQLPPVGTPAVTTPESDDADPEAPETDSDPGEADAEDSTPPPSEEPGADDQG